MNLYISFENIFKSNGFERLTGFFRNLFFSGRRIRTSIKILLTLLAIYFILVLFILIEILSGF